MKKRTVEKVEVNKEILETLVFELSKENNRVLGEKTIGWYGADKKSPYIPIPKAVKDRLGIPEKKDKPEIEFVLNNNRIYIRLKTEETGENII